MYACDSKWWHAYFHEANSDSNFIKEAWTQDLESAERYGLSYIEGFDDAGLCKKEGRIFTGGNSGYQAIGLAYQIGARRIGLLGYDMQRTQGLDHWHGKHPRKLGDPHPDSYPVWAGRFHAIASDLRGLGIRCTNLSRATALTAFPRQTLESFVAE